MGGLGRVSPTFCAFLCYYPGFGECRLYGDERGHLRGARYACVRANCPCDADYAADGAPGSGGGCCTSRGDPYACGGGALEQPAGYLQRVRRREGKVAGG